MEFQQRSCLVHSIAPPKVRISAVPPDIFAVKSHSRALTTFQTLEKHKSMKMVFELKVCFVRILTKFHICSNNSQGL